MPHSQNHRFILDVMEKEKSYLSAIKAEVLFGEAPTNNWYYRKIFSGSKLLWKLNVRHTDTYRVRIGYYAREKGNNFLLEGPGGDAQCAVAENDQLFRSIGRSNFHPMIPPQFVGRPFNIGIRRLSFLGINHTDIIVLFHAAKAGIKEETEFWK